MASRVRCPFCAGIEDRVVDSREGKAGEVIRRRRECLSCGKRFTSYERIEDIPFMVVKQDGKRQLFEQGKLMGGLLKAAEKRSIGLEQMEEIVAEVIAMLHDSPNREMDTRRIGEVVMGRLRELDHVAYVRFASVYRRFEDANQFMEELKGLLKKS